MEHASTTSTGSDEADTMGVIIVENTNITFSIEHADLNIQPTHLSEEEKQRIIDASAAEIFGQPVVQDALRELSKL